MTYRTGTALLPQLMDTCTRRGFRILQVKLDRLPGDTDPVAHVLPELEGTADTGQLTSDLFHKEGVIGIAMTSRCRPRQPGQRSGNRRSGALVVVRHGDECAGRAGPDRRR